MAQKIAPAPEQKEKAQHGEYVFPLQRYITILKDFHPVVTAHWHEEAELTRILKGACTYQIALETYEAKAGDLIFIPPMILHSITVSDGTEMRSETYVFHMNFLGANAADICALRYLLPIQNQTLLLPFVLKPSHDTYSKSFRVFKEISRTYKKAAFGYELHLKSLLLRFLHGLLPYGTEVTEKPQIQTEHMDKLKLVLEYIENHHTEEISIAALAKICYFSEYHFMRFFKKYMGMSCVEYIKNLRLEKAAKLFEQGETDTLDVSLSVGFHNLSYFHREFKKKYGVTPKQFRGEHGQ